MRKPSKGDLNMLKLARSTGFNKAYSVILDFSNINRFQGERKKSNFIQ